MAYEPGMAGAGRLEEYLSHIGTHLRDKRKRESFAMYAFGILGEGARKSAEPIAARACGGNDPVLTHRTHNKLLHFLARSKWSDESVRLEAARYAIEEVGKHEDITTWIVDDTGFLKQGTHSVGVQRQYTGSAGKTANCQIGVSLAVATPTQQFPVDFALYLPRSWAEDDARRSQARIPDEVLFQTKTELALGMIGRALDAGIPGELLLADSAYGDCAAFRQTVRFLGLDYAVGVKKHTKVVRVDAKGAAKGTPLTCEELADLSSTKYKKLTWRRGTKQPLSDQFAFIRVKTTHEDGESLAEREVQWLIIQRQGEKGGVPKFILTTLSRPMPRKKLIRIIMERWRTERMYQELKGELGLDHFEGRSFPGWHHHVSVVICCYAFVVAERARSFSPSAEGAATSRPHEIAARASLRRFLRHDQARYSQMSGTVAATLSNVPSTTSSIQRNRETLLKVGVSLRQ